MAIYSLAKYNQIFSKAACLSSAILGNLEADVLEASIDANTRLYLSWGSQEAGPSQGDPWQSRAAKANLAYLLPRRRPPSRNGLGKTGSHLYGLSLVAVSFRSYLVVSPNNLTYIYLCKITTS